MAIKNNTLLIIGAGASCPYSLPTGIQLIDLLSRDSRYLQLVLEGVHGHDPKYKKIADGFTNELRRSGSRSIDKFLETRPDYQELGKAAIASLLLPIEQNALTHYSMNSHWISILFDRLRDDPKTLHRDQVKYITFNYDRLLEIFLIDMLQSAYKMPRDSATEIVRSLDIIHPYGHFDFDLEFNRIPIDRTPVDSHTGMKKKYISSRDGIAVKAASLGIKIMSEDRESESSVRLFENCKNLIHNWAESVYFLGFGFDSLNCERIGISGGEWVEEKNFLHIGSTFYSLRERQIQLACREIGFARRHDGRLTSVNRHGANRNVIVHGNDGYDCAMLLDDWF